MSAAAAAKRDPKVLSENDLRLIRQRALFNSGITIADLDNLIHTIRTLRTLRNQEAPRG